MKVILCFCLSVCAVLAGAPGEVDLSFEPGSSIRGGVFPLLALAEQPDGKAIIAGEFVNVHGAARNRIARLGIDGATDLSFLDNLTGIDNKIQALALQPDGKILVAGLFLKVNGHERSRIARLNPDGSTDRTFQEDMKGVTGGLIPTVNAITLQSDGRVLIGGGFSQVNGSNRNGIARLNADGSLDATFQNAAPNGVVFAVALQPDGRVLIGGNFTTIGSSNRIRIARLNSDGSLDPTFQPGPTGANNNVRCIALQSDGKVIIGGDFSDINGEPHFKVARLHDDGSLDKDFQNPTQIGPGSGVSALAVQPDGKIVVGGVISYYSVGLQSRGGLTRLNSDGTRDFTFDKTTGANNPVDALLLRPNGQILVGGRFTAFDDVPRIGVALVNSDGTLDRNYQNGPQGVDDFVRKLAVQKDGRILVGGHFGFADETARRGLVRLNFNGGFDDTFGYQTESGLNGSVFGIAIQPDGRSVIVGDFSQVHGSNRFFIARLGADGKLDETFGYNGSGASSPPHAVILQDDGKVLVAGPFASVNGTQRNSVARLTSTGALDPTFNAGAGASALVNNLALQEDGKILASGWFGVFANQTHGGIVRLLPSGDPDVSFQSGLAGANNRVDALVLLSDGRILIGGEFTTVNGVGRNRIARLLPDGSVDPSFGNNLLLVEGAVRALYQQPDGRVLVGGLFARVNGIQRNCIARLEATGALDVSFMNNLAGANEQVAAIAMDRNGNILIGGNFTQVNGISFDRVARLQSGLPCDPSLSVSVNSAAIAPGGTATLTATTSASNPSYLWVPGNATTASIDVSPQATTIYTVIVKDGVTGCTTTGQGTVTTFSGRVYLVQNPIGPEKPIPLGQRATFSAEALGLGPITYQWLHNGVAIAGATAPTLVIDPVSLADGGRYAVRIFDGLNRVESPPASLILDIPLLPAADAFGPVAAANSNNRITGLQGSNRGSLATATAEKDEPAHAGIPALASLWVGWAPEKTGVATLDTYGSGTDTRLAVYRRENLAQPVEFSNLRLIRANDNDSALPGQSGSRLQFNATAGETYFIAIDSADVVSGDFVLSWSLEVTEQLTPVVSPTLPSANFRAGESTSIGINIILDPLAVRREISWTRSGQPVTSDINGTIVISAFGPNDVGSYQAEVREFFADGSFRASKTDPIELQLYRRSNNTDADILAMDRLLDLNRQVASRPRALASARQRAKPQALSPGITGQQVFRTEGSTRDFGEPLHGGEDSTNSMWYPLIMETDGVVTVDTAESKFDTILVVYHDEGVSDDRNPYKGLRQIVVNDDANPLAGVRTSRAEFCARGLETYQVVVVGKAGASGMCFLNYSVRSFKNGQLCPPPEVTCPVRVGLRNARVGTTVQIQAQVSGRDPLKLRWFRGETFVAETTNPELSLYNLQTADSGMYRLEVSNTEGKVSQNIMILNVVTDARPVLGYLQECEGDLRIMLTGSSTSSYVLEALTEAGDWTILGMARPGLGSYEFPVTPAMNFLGYRARLVP